MGTTTAEPKDVPEKKIKYTEDDALLVESEAEKKSRTIRSDETRVRRHAKRNQRQNARKANTSANKNKTEIDGAQEAEEADGPGKWVMSSEYSHGLN